MSADIIDISPLRWLILLPLLTLFSWHIITLFHYWYSHYAIAIIALHSVLTARMPLTAHIIDIRYYWYADIDTFYINSWYFIALLTLHWLHLAEYLALLYHRLLSPHYISHYYFIIIFVDYWILILTYWLPLIIDIFISFDIL
jgi:hypothetical protein